MRLLPGVTAMLEARDKARVVAEQRYQEHVARRRALGEHFYGEGCPVGCRGADALGIAACSLAVLRPWAWLSEDEQRGWEAPYAVDVRTPPSGRVIGIPYLNADGSAPLDFPADIARHQTELRAINARVNQAMADHLGWRYCGAAGFHRLRSGRRVCDCGLIRREPHFGPTAEYECEETEANRITRTAAHPCGCATRYGATWAHTTHCARHPLGPDDPAVEPLADSPTARMARGEPPITEFCEALCPEGDHTCNLRRGHPVGHEHHAFGQLLDSWTGRE